jgi:hypothetical protein
MTTCASACNPIDFVSAAGTVRVPQDLISGLDPSLIDFRMRYESCPGCKKPSVLAGAFILKLSRSHLKLYDL